jgi:hypothetical protein
MGDPKDEGNHDGSHVGVSEKEGHTMTTTA